MLVVSQIPHQKVRVVVMAANIAVTHNRSTHKLSTIWENSHFTCRNGSSKLELVTLYLCSLSFFSCCGVRILWFENNIVVLFWGRFRSYKLKISPVYCEKVLLHTFVNKKKKRKGFELHVWAWKRDWDDDAISSTFFSLFRFVVVCE